MTEFSTHVEVQLDGKGRLVIPVSLRKSLGVEPGDRLVARLESGQLVLEKLETIQHRLRARFFHLKNEASLADELIAERREDAKRDMVGE